MVDFNQDLNTGGVKHDIGKPRMDLIPPNVMLWIGDLFGKGAVKYDDRNWEKGMDGARTMAAAERHIQKWKAGEDFDEDPVAGTHHLIHAAWNIMVLFEMLYCGLTEDQRTKLRPFATGGPIMPLTRLVGEHVNESVVSKKDLVNKDVDRKIDLSKEAVISLCPIRDFDMLTKGKKYNVVGSTPTGRLVINDDSQVQEIHDDHCVFGYPIDEPIAAPRYVPVRDIEFRDIQKNVIGDHVQISVFFDFGSFIKKGEEYGAKIMDGNAYVMLNRDSNGCAILPPNFYRVCS